MGAGMMVGFKEWLDHDSSRDGLDELKADIKERIGQSASAERLAADLIIWLRWQVIEEYEQQVRSKDPRTGAEVLDSISRQLLTWLPKPQFSKMEDVYATRRPNGK